MYKIYSQLLLTRLQTFISNNRILHQAQAGFRRGFSTYDNIFVLSSIVEHNVAKPVGKVFAFFIDFKAAFDTVNRSSLLYKLENVGVSSKIIEAVRNIYSHTTAKVWTKLGFTDVFSTYSGVRQGCLLSPLLFTIFINDLCDDIDLGGFCYNGVWIRLLMYADDIVFLAADPETLQGMIDKLANYCERWDLVVNLAKSKVVVFRKPSMLKKSFGWTYNGVKIEIVKEYKYLGVLFTSSGRFSVHMDRQLAVAKCALNTVYRRVFKIGAVNLDSYLKIFEAVARSIVCYAAQVWGHQKFDPVEKTYRFFLKKLLRLPYNTPNYMLFLEMAQDSIYLYALKIHWSFLLKTLKLEDGRFRKIMLEVGQVYELDWFKQLKSLAQEFDLWEGLTDFSYENLEGTFETLLEKVREKERQFMWEQVRDGTMHPIYKNIKFNWGREKYLEIGLPIKSVGLIFMARTDMLPLNYKPWFDGGEDQRDYKCTFCDMQADENVEHFLLICPKFRQFRSEGFQNTSCFDILEGALGWYELAKFLSNAINYRSFLLQ